MAARPESSVARGKALFLSPVTYYRSLTREKEIGTYHKYRSQTAALSWRHSTLTASVSEWAFLIVIDG